MLVFMAVVAVLSPAKAQISSGSVSGSAPFSASLTLNDQQETYGLAPYIYVTRDESGTLSYQELMKRHLAGQRGTPVRGSVLNLGPLDTPHWIVFSVSNESWNDDWVLSFGNHFEGRTGLIQDLFVFEHNSRTRFFDNITSSNNPYIDQNRMRGTALPISLERGQRAIIVLYIKPEPGLPTSLSLQLLSEAAHVARLSNIYHSGQFLNLYLLAMAGLFAGALLFRRAGSAIFLLLYYIVQIALFNLHNGVIFPQMALSAKMPGLLFCLGVVLALAGTKLFLDIGKLQRRQSHMIIGFMATIFLSSLAGLFMASETTVQPLLTFMPALAGLLFISLLSFAQARNERHGAHLFALSWLVLFGGALISFLAFSGMFLPTAFYMSAYWWAIIPQGAFLAAALMVRLLAQDRERRAARALAAEDADEVRALKQTKEALENARLLRLIEHERMVLNDLRAREVAQNEEMRSAKEYADQANQAKSAFLAVVSHEIRTPMTGVMGMVRLLMDTSLSKEQKNYALTIQDSGDAMMALLNDILDFEKIESGKMDIEHVDFDLGRVINSIVTLMSGHAETKNIYLKAEIDPDLPRYVIGDPVRLRQVLLNLAGNSIKFTAKGGVTLRIKKAAASSAAMAEKGMCRIVFAVEDTGIGISEEAQKNLFNPFQQAESSTARKFGGTGLGLTISQKLIEAMGGKIRIDSTEGRGSTFHFTLLMEEGRADIAEDMAGRNASVGPKSSKQLHILIVEDNEVSQRLLKEFVDRMGHDTVLAGSGEDALALIEQQDFDMALMDIELPGITGMGATKAIRALPEAGKAKMPVIALTGNVRDEDISQCYAANMNGHLAKPVDPKKLQHIIEKVISGQLDNPVEIEENQQEVASHVHQVPLTSENTPEPEPALEPAPEPELEKEQDSLALPGLQNGDEPDDSHHDIPLPPQEEAPLSRYLRGTEDISAVDDIAAEDLDEDSFETALRSMEEQQSDRAETPGPAEENVLDSALLDNLRKSIGDDVFNSLLKDLFTKSEEIIAAMDQALATQDMSALAARAHELKGMAANFGLTEMSQSAARLETLIQDSAQGPENSECGALVKDLSALYERAQTGISGWMEDK